MKLISETQGIKKLAEIRESFRSEVADRYEHRARPCASCPTPGACCLDEHFVNVRLSRIETAAVKRALSELSDELRTRVMRRAEDAIAGYGLADDESATFACPLYEKGVGCLVHATAKPLPCIAHACYERPEDLPPENLLDERETEIGVLGKRVYGSASVPQPIPVAIMN